MTDQKNRRSPGMVGFGFKPSTVKEGNFVSSDFSKAFDGTFVTFSRFKGKKS